MKQSEMFERFRSLHGQDGMFVMPNAWDGLSALLLREAGFAALGSSSAAIAFGLGHPDGVHAVSREGAIANAALLSGVSGLPVNGDLEDGFGPEPEACVATVEAAIAGGLAGLGIEDTTTNPQAPIHDFDQAVERVRAAAAAARGRILLTGRTDNFIQGRPDLDDTIRRLVAFAEVGADVLFAPGLPDLDSIRAVVQAVAPKPVNVVVGPGPHATALEALRQAGVKRVSLGASLYRRAMTTLRDDARALADGQIVTPKASITSAEITSLLAEIGS